jgi:hypothetical protein
MLVEFLCGSCTESHLAILHLAGHPRRQISGPDATQYEILQWTLLNSGVSLVGCEPALQFAAAAFPFKPTGMILLLPTPPPPADYAAAFTIDRSWWGRRRMQVILGWKELGSGHDPWAPAFPCSEPIPKTWRQLCAQHGK